MKSARAEIKRGVDLISDALPFGPLWYEDAGCERGNRLRKVLQPVTCCRDPRLR